MSVSETRPIAIEDELKNSYLDYAMSVIVSRCIARRERWSKTCSSSCAFRYARVGQRL